MSNMSNGFKKIVSLILGVVLIMGSSGLENVFASQMKDFYTIEELSRMRTSDLIEVISTVDKENIRGLFEASDAAYELYSDERKMNAIIEAFIEKGETFTENDDKGIPTMSYFLRSASYLGFYDRQDYMDMNAKLSPKLPEDKRVKGKYEKFYERSYRDKCIPAILATQNNPNFKIGTESQNNVIKAVAELVGGCSSNADVVNGFIPVLEDFYENRVDYINDDEKPAIFHKIVSSLSYEISSFFEQELDILRNNPENEILVNYEKTHKRPENYEDLTSDEKRKLEEIKNRALTKELAKDSNWFGRIDEFIELMIRFSEIEDKKENTMILENTSHGLSNIGILHTDNEIGNRALTKAMENYTYLSRNYLRVVHDIEYYEGGINSKGEDIKFSEIREKAQNKYHGNIYSFDDGKLIIKAGDKVREDKILKFYWATKEVEAQYFRSLGTDEPVEITKEDEFVKVNRTDDVLTMVIYNNKYEYEINNSINFLATNNGGMYIKDNGTLYTFERPRTDSSYNLEELIKHEYAHYMQGRYVANSEYWGQGKFYESGNMTWYEEGGAEYFAGSTRTDGVVARSSIVKDIFNTDNKYSFKRGLESRYSDGNSLYYHAFLLMNYASENEPEIYHDLTQYIREDNFEEFEKYVKKLERMTEKEAKYSRYLEDLKNSLGDLYVPNASEVYLEEHIDKDADEILDEVRKTTGLKDLRYELKSSDKFETIKIEGKYEDDAWYGGEVRDRAKMNEIADNMLKELSNLEWSGYDTFTMYFKNYDKLDESKNNSFTYDVVLHGVKSSEKFVLDPKNIGKVYPVITIGDGNKTKEYIRFTSWDSTTDNGDIDSYKWIIDGKEYTNDYVDYIFDEPGEYEIKLIVKDELGVEGETTKIINIERKEGEEAPEDPTQSNENLPRINEEESNNDFASANLLKKANVMVGQVDYDDEDYFYFDIEEEGDYSVELVKLLGDSCTFNIYSERNLEDKFSYGSFIPGTSKKIRSKEHYTPGRYFVKIYAFKDETIQYELELK